MPVRERLLLVLPDREIFDYLCTGCGSSVGQREVTAGDKLMAQAMAEAASAARAHANAASLRRDARRLHRHGRNRRADAASAAAIRRTPTRRSRHAAGQTGRARAANRAAADQESA